jgi:hypothetical protein
MMSKTRIIAEGVYIGQYEEVPRHLALGVKGICRMSQWKCFICVTQLSPVYILIFYFDKPQNKETVNSEKYRSYTPNILKDCTYE